MLPIQGRPMLDHILERLFVSGVSRFLIVTGYHAEVIERHFANSSLQIRVRSAKSGQRHWLGRTPGREFADGESFLLTYGDILCDPAEYARAISILLNNPATAAAVAVKAVDDPWQGAAVYEDNGHIGRILEKPPKGTSTTRWNSAGFYTSRPVIFDYLSRLQPSPRGEYELTSALDGMLADGLDLRISPVKGAWHDVGRPEDLAAVNALGSAGP